ncbi:hypothetical protein [Kerstersia sp.]|uniref:hypothetical protein n=1 Tax=Kerstersia sp. TaxID=1930783 RepID=UPI003F914959
MTYTNISPPFSLDFREMPKTELKNYAKWFHEILPVRIKELESFVQSTAGFEKWQADFTPDSLNQLDSWFEEQIETRTMTQDEIEETRRKLVIPIEIGTTELSNRTFSLAIDIGMYFGQTLLKGNPKLKWGQNLKSKRHIDYGQPILIGQGSIPCNPVGLLITRAYAITRKSKNKKELLETYKIWANILST